MKRFFLVPFAAAGAFLSAQSIGNSPYAAFGIGEVKYDNTTDISAMGGISTAYISDFNNKFNFKNPAANGNLDLTSFNIEGTNENNFFRSDFNDLKATKHSTYLSNISIAFPLSRKMKFGLGYQPYSSKAYDILTTSKLSDESTLANHFTGSGSLSTVQAALSYNINENFALGIRSNFYFGVLHDLEEITYSNSELINGFETKNKIKSFNFTAGATYQHKSEEDHKITVGATYTFGTTGKMETRYTNSTYFYAGQDKSNESIIREDISTDKNLLPMGGSLGFGYGREGRWFASAQVDYTKGETVTFLGEPFQYKNAYKIAAGGWYLPNYNNFRNYFSRVTYRFGAYYDKGSLDVGATSASGTSNINKFAVTYGMTLPFANSGINRINGLDLGLEVGKRGTLQNNLISQTFVNVKIGLIFADKWFQKRTYD